MQWRSVSEFKYSLEESGFTFKTFEFKSQMDDIKVVHHLVNQRKHMKMLDRMNLNKSEVMDLPSD